MSSLITVGTNCYISLSDAKTLLGNELYGITGWTNASDTVKEKALILATRNIDKLKFKGRKVDINQTLQFPRFMETKLYDDFFTELAQVEIGDILEMATALEAAAILEQGNNTDQRQELINSGVTSMSIGNISESYSSSRGTVKLLSSEAQALLNKYTIKQVQVI